MFRYLKILFLLNIYISFLSLKSDNVEVKNDDEVIDNLNFGYQLLGSDFEVENLQPLNHQNNEIKNAILTQPNEKIEQREKNNIHSSETEQIIIPLPDLKEQKIISQHNPQQKQIKSKIIQKKPLEKAKSVKKAYFKPKINTKPKIKAYIFKFNNYFQLIKPITCQIDFNTQEFLKIVKNNKQMQPNKNPSKVQSFSKPILLNNVGKNGKNYSYFLNVWPRAK